MPTFKAILDDDSEVKLVGPHSECPTLEAAVEIAERLHRGRWKVVVVPELSLSVSRDGVQSDPHWLFKIAESLDHQNLGLLYGEPPMFACIEYGSGFAVRHIPSGKEHWMSDGVDCLFDADDQAISPGTPDFTALWSKSLNDGENETLEAYFPDLVEDD